MLEDLIRKLPRGLFATIAIALGIAIIVLLNPMHSPCDSQMKLFVEDLDPLLFTKPNPKLANSKASSLYTKYKDSCLAGYTQGSCLSWFDALNSIDRKLINIPSQCNSRALNLPEVKQAIVESVDVVTRMAWGAKPPMSYYQRNSWLDAYHVSVFCSIKSWWVELKGKDAWAQYRETMLKELPGAQALGREEAWKRSIFSNSCK